MTSDNLLIYPPSSTPSLSHGPSPNCFSPPCSLCFSHSDLSAVSQSHSCLNGSCTHCSHCLEHPFAKYLHGSIYLTSVWPSLRCHLFKDPPFPTPVLSPTLSFLLYFPKLLLPPDIIPSSTIRWLRRKFIGLLWNKHQLQEVKGNAHFAHHCFPSI